jgi:hypothetical protein
VLAWCSLIQHTAEALLNGANHTCSSAKVIAICASEFERGVRVIANGLGSKDPSYKPQGRTADATVAHLVSGEVSYGLLVGQGVKLRRKINSAATAQRRRLASRCSQGSRRGGWRKRSDKALRRTPQKIQPCQK